MPAYKDTKRGTWFVKYQITDTVSGARKAVVKRGFPTKREALDYEAKQRTGGTESPHTAFRDVMAKYYAYRKPKPKTQSRQLAMLEKYFPYMDADVSKISRQMMMDWILDFSGESLEVGSKNLVLCVVKSIFKFGADFYELPNPSSGLKRFTSNKKQSDLIVWTVPEFNQFIQFVPLREYRNAYYFVYWTGLRRGEVAGLQYTDFDPEKHTVHIWRQMTDHGFDDLKTPSSDRVLTLPPVLWDFIEPILAERNEKRPFVFGGETSLCLSSMSTYMQNAIKASGVKRITLHQMRHSFATNAINAGCDIVAVSRYLGHSSINITLSVYTHLLQKTADRMISTINDMMQQ